MKKETLKVLKAQNKSREKIERVNQPQIRSRKVYEDLKKQRPPGDIAERQYGHALGALYPLVEWEEEHGEVPDWVKKDTRRRIQEWMDLKILPENTFDLLGWEKELEDWRE